MPKGRVSREVELLRDGGDEYKYTLRISPLNGARQEADGGSTENGAMMSFVSFPGVFGK